MIRVILLLLPILFHSYTGTALRFAICYQWLYWATLFIATIHLMALCFFYYDSFFTALVPIPIERQQHSHFKNNLHVSLLLHDLRRILGMLGLSILSTICHLFLFMHVRSTAPSHSVVLFGKTKPPSVYFALRSQVLQDDTLMSEESVTGRLLENTNHNESDSNGMKRTKAAANSESNPATEPAVMLAMNGFVDEVQTRLLRTKADWTARLEDFTNRLAHHHHDAQQQRPSFQSRSNHQHRGIRSNPLLPLTPFRVLLQLFAYQDVLDNGKLDYAFDLDDGASMIFFVPQLLSFLLHGAVLNSPKLEEWILDKCRRNAHFAHRCYWFLRAWCLEEDTTTETMKMMSRQNSDSHLNGLTPFLDEPASPQAAEVSNNSHLCSRAVIAATTVSTSTRSASGALALAENSSGDLRLSSSAAVNGKFLPEERAMIERLMLRVKECGETAASSLEYGYSLEESTAGAIASSSSVISSERNSNHNNQAKNETSKNAGGAHGSTSPPISRPTSPILPSSASWQRRQIGGSPSDIMSAAELGTIPIDPMTGCPSVKHLDCISSPYTYGFLPVQEDEYRHNRIGVSPARDEGGEGETDNFDKTPRLLDALIFLADSLYQVPKNHRKDELRKQLRMLECDLLPSNATYVPIGNVHHRIWRIVADESIPIGTKERVPCIVCLEVVDYTPKRRRAKTWGFLDRLPGRALLSSTNSTDSLENLSSEQQAPAQRSSSEEETELPDLQSESEIINEWRFRQRDPLRRSSLFDKVSSTIRGPLDKARGQISSFRDVLLTEERRALTLSELLEEANGGLKYKDRLTGPPVASDLESGLKQRRGNAKQENGGDRQSLSRASSGGSLASMGQWSSPPPGNRQLTQVPNKRLDDVRRGISQIEGSESPQLRYGSDEEERNRDTLLTEFDRPSVITTTTVRRPVVVFRESWEAKQERVRKQSAFGSHPGWRLLPVLIKANDDLRQEQLASQLIYRMAVILAKEKVPVWLCPYEIIALTGRGGIIEAIPDTISLDSLKRNDTNFTSLKSFFESHFGVGTEAFADAQANFLESLSAYCIVCFLLQLKDRHNGNILLDNRGHVIHIDFGFFFLASPGKNVGFESAPFKLTRDFVELLGGPQSRLFRSFRELCIKTFITLRRHCMEIILLVEMLKTGNEDLPCFRGRPDEAIRQLRDRFRLDLNDRACREYVNSLVDNSIENWTTDWYDRYQRYFVGVL